MIKNDNFIIFFIKYVPIIFVILLSIVATNYVLYEKDKEFKEEINNLTNEYYQINKTRAKEEVSRVYKLIKTEQEQKELLLKQKLKQRVNQAHSLSTAIYEKYKDSKSKKQLLMLLKTTLSSINFETKKNYFFILDNNANFILQPFVKEKDLYFKENILPKVTETIKNKTQNFHSYSWYKNKNSAEKYKKISFYKYFEPLDLLIGTGQYIQEFENKLKKQLLQRIQNIRYGKDFYIFVIDYKGNYLAHFNKEFIGKNRINFKNDKGRYLVKDIINFAKTNSGEFMTYIASLSTYENSNSNKKISYIIGLDDYKWAIGTGFYTEPLNKKLNIKKQELNSKKDESVNKILKVSIALTLIVLAISFFISKTLEARLKKYKEKIEQKVNENKEKDYMLYQQSKMATMGEMIANIAHQWKQPLTHISTISSGIKMKKELGILDTNTISESMDTISKSVQYLSVTVDDFKEFFSPNKKSKTFNINNTLDKTLKLIESKIKANNILIIKNKENIEVNSYENELLQVLINILKNSLDALLENRKDKPKYIFIKTKDLKTHVQIEIKDNAGGINEEIINSIFEAYFTTKEDKGTGIGLYMSKKIITDSIKGTLDVNNEEFTYQNKTLKGACFKITIYKN